MKNKKTYVVLFNYGGGMRGLVPAHMMAMIEERTGLQMADMVDVFAGPSTGAILNAALNVPHPDNPGRPKYLARHMVKFYERDGQKIFPPDRFRDFRGLIHDFNNRTMRLAQLKKLFKHGHYNPAHLGSSLNALYGDTKLSDALRSLIIPVYNIDGEQLKVAEEDDEDENAPVRTKNNFIDEGGYAVWLKNIRIKGNKHITPKVSLYDSIIASCAAPTFFPCHHFSVDYADQRGTMEYSGIDGSIFDNPCVSYFGAIRQHLPEDANVIMILLGTGYTLRSINKDQWNSYGGLGVVDPVNELPLINILFHASESALVEGFRQNLNGNLYAFNKSLVSAQAKEGAPSLEIDDASPENLAALGNFAQEIVNDNQSHFDMVCDLLVANYEQNKSRAGGGLLNIVKKITGNY